jgi:hypothetical protein
VTSLGNYITNTQCIFATPTALSYRRWLSGNVVDRECEMEYVIGILLLIPPGLIIATYLILVDRPFFWRTVAAHLVIFASYLTFLYFFSKEIAGHDEYGLGRLVLTLFIMVVHIIIGFIHALYIRKKYPRLE